MNIMATPAINVISPSYLGENDALIPEWWANESLALLEENFVLAQLFWKNFDERIQSSGDTINIARPSAVKTRRKNADESVITSPVNATNVAIVLNQHVYNSIVLKDEDLSKSFKDLKEFYLRGQVVSIARDIERSIAGQVAQVVLTNRFVAPAGAVPDTVLSAGLNFDNNKVDPSGRFMVISPLMQKQLKSQDLFVSAERVGDDGSALRSAQQGKVFDFNFFMSQNVPAINDAQAADSFNTTTTAAASAGATVINVTAATNMAVGKFIQIGNAPYQITAINTLAISISPALDYDVASGATVTTYVLTASPVLVNQTTTTFASGSDGSTAGYRAGWHNVVEIDGAGTKPRAGSIVCFGASTGQALYTVIDTDTTSILLDRPLDAAIADNAPVNIAPPASYNIAAVMDAIAIVNRPLAKPNARNVDSAVISFNGLSMRVVISYDPVAQGTRITIDTLFGIKVLDYTKLQAVIS